jgi:hypothetical protein
MNNVRLSSFRPSPAGKTLERCWDVLYRGRPGPLGSGPLLPSPGDTTGLSEVQGECTVSNGIVYVPLDDGQLVALGQ